MDNKISKSWSVLKDKLGDSLRSAEGWGGFAVFFKNRLVTESLWEKVTFAQRRSG